MLFWHYAYLGRTGFLSKAPFYSNLIPHTQQPALLRCLVILNAIFHSSRNLRFAAAEGSRHVVTEEVCLRVVDLVTSIALHYATA